MQQPDMVVDQCERLLPAKEVYGDRLRISRSTFYDLIRTGGFPAPVQVTKQRVAWPASVVDRWIRDRPIAARLQKNSERRETV